MRAPTRAGKVLCRALLLRSRVCRRDRFLREAEMVPLSFFPTSLLHESHEGHADTNSCQSEAHRRYTRTHHRRTGTCRHDRFLREAGMVPLSYFPKSPAGTLTRVTRVTQEQSRRMEAKQRHSVAQGLSKSIQTPAILAFN